MKSIALFVALLIVANSMALAETEEQSRVIIKTRVTTQYSAKKSTIIFTLEPGTEKTSGPKYPKI